MSESDVEHFVDRHAESVSTHSDEGDSSHDSGEAIAVRKLIDLSHTVSGSESSDEEPYTQSADSMKSKMHAAVFNDYKNHSHNVCEPENIAVKSKMEQSLLPDELSIFTMTWNTESVLIAETMQRSGQEAISMYSGQWLGCLQPDFLPQLIKEHIFRGNADDNKDSNDQGRHHLLVVALQESAKPGDYLLSNALSNELGERYVLVKRGRMMGIGLTSVKALKREAALRARGLRLAIYARKDFEQFVHFQDEKAILCTIQDRFTRGKGGYGIVLRVDGFGLMAFLNIHLPFVASTLTRGNHARLTTGVRHQNEAFCTILKQFLTDRALHHLFVLGDLNYRVMHLENIVDAAGLCDEMVRSEEFRARIYAECDELRQSVSTGQLPLPFEEGIDNVGPQFMPTAKMKHDRRANSTQTGAYVFGKHNHRNPSWCDRILYLPGSLQKTRTIGQLLSDAADRQQASSSAAAYSNEPARCTFYNRFESGNTMTKSDHSAVCAYFTIKRPL